MAYTGAHTGPEVDDAVGTAKGSGTGILVKTGTGSGLRRTLVAGSASINITDGNGVINNPTIDLSAAAKASLGLADTAVQPGSLSPVATSGNYNDLSNKPTLGTASAQAIEDFASAAQGTLADTALQTSDIDTLTKLNTIITNATLIDTNDSRLSNARTPLAHAASHAAGSGDPITPAAIQAATAAQGALADTAVQPSRQVNTGTGLTGGGDLSANRTLALDSATIASLALADTALQPGDPNSIPNANITSTQALGLWAENWELRMNGGGNITITIPSNASEPFPVGAKVSFIQQSAPTTTIQAASGVTLNGVSQGSCTLDQYNAAVLTKVATDAWIIVGGMSDVS